MHIQRRPYVLGALLRQPYRRRVKDFLRRLLRHLAATEDLANVVIVLDNAPCHSKIEKVLEEDEFSGAYILRLGPYSPMLNPIENVFSSFKAAVKKFLALNRQAIIHTLDSTQGKLRQSFLMRAADLLLEEVVTKELCVKCYDHTLKIHPAATLLMDMPVGLLFDYKGSW